MVNVNIKIKYVVAVGLLAAFFLLSKNHVLAQNEPKFIFSWKTTNYVPADFQGKILPSKTSFVEVGFDLVDGNKIVDLSRNEITWHLNNNFLRIGIGLKTTSFQAQPSGQTVRITVSDYKGRDLIYNASIPTTNPDLVIDAKTVSRDLKLGSYLLTALPYYFNAANLSEINLNWLINGQAPAQQISPDIISLDLSSQGTPQETDFPISVSARNTLNQLEMASRKINFTVK